MVLVLCVFISRWRKSNAWQLRITGDKTLKTHFYLAAQSQTGSSFPENASLWCSHLLPVAPAAPARILVFSLEKAFSKSEVSSAAFSSTCQWKREALHSTRDCWPFCTKTTPSIFALLQNGSGLELTLKISESQESVRLRQIELKLGGGRGAESGRYRSIS